MAKTNTHKTKPYERTHEGAPAAKIDALAELRRSLMACMLFEDTFYEGGEDIAERLAKLARAVRPEQAAAAAIEARTVMNIRHAPLLVAAALAYGDAEQRRVVGGVLAEIVRRADEPAEFLSLYWGMGSRKLAAQVKRGLARAFRRFDAYQLAKYDRPAPVRPRDAMFLSHPKPKDDAQALAFKQLAVGELPAPDTWEVALSAGKDKRETWERLIGERKLGALAFLRNLRNMRQAGVPADLVREGLLALDVRKVLPFRFVAAWRAAPDFEPELEALMFRALREAPRLAGRTVLVVDRSGSMADRLSGKSDMSRLDAAGALAMLLQEVCQWHAVIAFDAAPEAIPPVRGFGLLRQIGQPRGSTNTQDAKRMADSMGYDRVVIVTDEQSHQAITPPADGARGYVVNVAAYRRGIGYGAWRHVDGWSDAVVAWISALEAVEEGRAPALLAAPVEAEAVEAGEEA